MSAIPSDNLESELRSLDELFAIEHPIQRQKMFKFLDFTRVNGRFKFENFLLLKLSLFLLGLDCLGNIINITTSILNNEVNKLQETFATFSLELLFFFRGLSLVTNKKELAKLYNDLDDMFPRTIQGQKHMEVSKSFDELSNRFRIFHPVVSCALLLYVATPTLKFFLFYDFEAMGPISDDFHQNASWLPFQLRQRLTFYPLCCIYQTWLTLLACNMYITWDEVFVIPIAQICMYIHYLNKQLEELDVRASTISNSKAFQEQLRSYMVQQQYLYSLAHDLNNIFNLSIFVSDLAASISICCNLYLITSADDYMSIAIFILAPILISWLLYDTAQWGTRLEMETTRLNEVLYEKDWFYSTKDYRKYTLMWMQSTCKPLKLTAFELFEVNMEHFQDMMKLSYQLLTFIKSK